VAESTGTRLRSRRLAPAAGSLLKYSVQIRFGEEPETMPEGMRFGRVSAVTTDRRTRYWEGKRRGRRGRGLTPSCQLKSGTAKNTPPKNAYASSSVQTMLNP
jgi:hypothetical protein